MKYSVVELKAELIVTLIHYILSLHTKFNHLIILVLVKSHFTMYIIILVTLTKMLWLESENNYSRGNFFSL
jgi:hypothetical protein